MTWKKTWVTGMVLVVAMALPTPRAFADSHCEPLLLLIGGGTGSRGGTTMEDVQREIEVSYAHKGIRVVLVHNSPFWKAYDWVSKAADSAARKIKSSGQWPVVIVGHSMGGATARNLANRFRTRLVVTLDATSFGRPRTFPRLAVEWVNVYNNDNDWGPDWGSNPNATDDIHTHAKHYDGLGLFRAVENRILGALQECPSARLRKTDPKSLCAADGVGCDISWTIRDRCDDGRGIDVRFHEYGLGFSYVTSWTKTYTIGSGTSREFPLSCDAPGNWVCYAAKRPAGGRWGVPWSSPTDNANCVKDHKCCLPCQVKIGGGRLSGSASLACSD